jgi:glycosyltransferase involved in cell wall biosynthesis
VRVLILTNLYPNPYQPNRAAFNRQQFQALAKEHSVRIIAPLSWIDELVGRAKGKGRLPYGRQVCYGDIAVEHPRYFYTPRALRGWHGHFYRRSVKRAFWRAVEEFQPNIVLGSWAYPDGWAAVKLGRRAGLPVVIKVHGCDVLYAGQGLDQHPVRKHRTVEALCGADAVVAVSRHLADRVAELGVEPKRVTVVHNGVDSALFHPGAKDQARANLGLGQGEQIVLFIGHLDYVKGLDVLIDAVARLVRTGLRFQCLLIGQGPWRQRLERQVASLGLNDTVRFLGPRAHACLPEWYNAADLFVLPSRSEGVPNVLLEAAACGTPFVASRVGGIPEIAHVGRSQLVPAEDAEALARAIEAQLTVPLGTLSAAGGSRAHEEAAAEMTALFESLVQEQRHRVPLLA